MQSSWGSGCVGDASPRRVVGLVRDVAVEDLVGKLQVALIKDLFRYTDGDMGDAGKGFKYRAIILEDVKGETGTTGLGSLASDFDEFLPEAQKVDSVKWGGS